ncbi:MAG: glycosyltransferase family 4 protein [Pseudorhodoplanes sp.]|uniref:glycosyltransferase family 4 protein n=1 Tax=Pseudorhodoplanes sp. TaxID=1934341 RepID=UPI003D13674B
MRVLVATDAWHPQVNGVVRTLSTLATTAPRHGAEIAFLTHEGFRSFPLPTYPGIRCALTTPWAITRRIDSLNPDAIHIATEGTIGHAVRRYCLRRGLAFTTSFHTRLPEYVAARAPIPERFVWRWLRRFHGGAERVMVSTRSLITELSGRGFRNPVLWPRGVDGEVFAPRRPALGLLPLDLPRPIFLTVGRVAVEKNIEAFLSLDLPGTKVVVGDGPMRSELMQRFPQAVFLGERQRDELAAIYSAADVFVFPSRTDTFGLVMLEALSCGIPVAAYPVPGPLDVIGDAPVGALDDDLRAACLRALGIDRTVCRAFASRMTWDRCARMFLDNLAILRQGATIGDQAPMPSAGARMVAHSR